MRRAFFSNLEFWQQLVIAFTVGIVFLAVATSVTLTITANQSVKNQIVDQSLYLTESIGRQSRLALLYQSAEEAGDAAAIALQFPDVIGVEIRTDRGAVLYSRGLDEELSESLAKQPDETVLSGETETSLIFVTPVKTQVDENSLWVDGVGQEQVEPQTLGYVTLVVSKKSLQEIGARLLQSNVIISTLVAIVLLIALLFLTRRLTNPLRKLSKVMHMAEEGELNLRATFNGPQDIQDMQKAFNTMMASLESRTRELQKARDQALESAKIKSEFAANVSHELRTPMNSVLGMLDLLSVMGLDSQQYEYVETAKLSAQNLLALIDDILSYVRADSGRLVLDEERCDLNKLMEDVVSLMSAQALKKRLDIGYLVEDCSPDIIIDGQRLRQILINLAGNAVKFTDRGEVAIKASLTGEPKPRLRISVKDTGIGIKDDAQQRIFEAFTQEDSTTTRKYGGTGLGLAICKQFTVLMGGEIEVASEQGSGSEFSLTLPYVPCLEYGSSTQQKNLLQNCKNIVVSDDSEIVNESISHWAGAHGANVFLAKNAAYLLELLNNWDSDGQEMEYLFIDENILGINFSDLLSVIREHKCVERARIILMVNPWVVTYHNDMDDCTVLEKPITASKLDNLFSVSTRTHDSPEIVRDRKGIYVDRLGLKVLVVDDNQANCLVAGGMLDQIGCQYELAYNGKDAIDRVTRKSFDVILMDCNMPVMDGYEATSVIRRLENESSTMPIVAMTANNSVEEKEHCLTSGMNDFIAKPLSVETLYKILSPWKSESAAQDVVLKVPEEGEKTAHKYSFDLSAVNSLKKSVGEVFGSVVNAFVEDTPIYLDALKHAIEIGDSKQVYELSHTIKGSASNFGGNKVSSIAKTIEDKGRSGDCSSCDRHYQELVDASNTLIADLKRFNLEGTETEVARDKANEIPTILVADDDRALRLAFSNALAGEGYRIIEASNGQSVLALCARTMPDLILIDAIMPQVDGFSACKQVRQMANGADVPILMVTSLEDEQSISKAFDAGATDYITKPANFAVLRQRVARLLQTSKTAKDVKKLAYQDALTGLPNRAFFNQQLRHMISRASLNEKRIAVLFLDLNRFKLINDSLGHDTGDLILKSAAERLQRCVRKSDLVARLGGDEFTVVLEDVVNDEIPVDVSKKITEALSKPFVFLNQKLFVSASIGISVFPDDARSIGELIKRADIAMFKAKESSTPYRYYQKGMEDEVLERLDIERGVRSAIENDQILLHYQPQFDNLTGAMRGVEALVRWQHPEKGLLSAGAFIEMIQETHLIEDIGGVVFRKACKQLKDWYDKGSSVRVAVNVSGGEFQDGKLRQQIFSLLDEYKFPPELLEIEITESMLMDQPEMVRSELSLLRQRGIYIAIDDFGSGFSSLNYLKNFSVDILKIDREFVKDCHVDKNDQAIISGIVALAKSLGLKVIAEGVEMEEQLEVLRQAGCDYSQGYYLSRPVSAEEITEQIVRKKLIFS